MTCGSCPTPGPTLPLALGTSDSRRRVKDLSAMVHKSVLQVVVIPGANDCPGEQITMLGGTAGARGQIVPFVSGGREHE